MKTALLFLSLLLPACANIPGVTLSEDERKACEASGCTVWTLDELTSVAKRVFSEGYKAGKASI